MGVEPRAERPAMAAYGVPDEIEGVLPWSWAEARLVASRSYWVTTVAADGRPHSLPVWGVWRPETTRFWFGCAPTARKLRNLAANPRVVVAVDDTVEVVSLEGTARVVDAAASEDAIARYLVKYWDDPAQHPEMDAFLRSNAMIEVTPERAFGIIEREAEFAIRATRWVW